MSRPALAAVTVDAQHDPVTEELRQLDLPPLTDAGNAERFAEINSMTLRYVHGWDRWLKWDGKRWAIDLEREVYRSAVDCIRRWKDDVPQLSSKTAEAVVKHAVRCEKRDRLEAMLGLARSQRALAIVPDRLDRDPFVLNVANGIVDLRTGTLSAHRHDALLTKLVPINFVPDADAPTWRRFLEKVLPDETVREYVRRAVGYSLTGEVSEHVLFFLFGTGRNGKSTFLELVRMLTAEYSKAASPDLLLVKRSDRHEEELAELHGARFVTTVEAGQDRSWDEARTKWVTGGDELTARHMYSSRFSFRPTHKLWIASNHKPHARGTDLGFWRRVHLVPFTVTIAEDDVDPDLRTKLEDELPGILRWAVEGAVAWRETGLSPPRAVRAAIDDYRSREDVVGAFLADCCVLLPHAKVTTQAIFSAYEKWAATNGERPMSKIDLGNALEDRAGITRYRSKSSRGLAGVGLRAGGDEGDDSASFSPSSTHTRAREEKLSETGVDSSPASPGASS